MEADRTISTRQLTSELAGGVDYIRTKGNQVKGLAIRLDLNPEAPERIIVGRGPRIEGKAKLLLNSHAIVPAYIKIRKGQWKNVGRYHATAYKTDAATINRYRNKRPAKDVAGILFLEQVDSPVVEISGRGFADPQIRRKIEIVAVNFATKWLENAGYSVTDRQHDNCGYDLLAVTCWQRLRRAASSQRSLQ